MDMAYRAEYDPSHFNSGQMKSWIGHKRDQQGHEFNRQVAARMAELGWEVRIEMKLPELLQKKQERDYGDIDVFAWDYKTQRVIVLECKHLFFAKTPGEVARQLAEYRGTVDKNGKPDRLKRHLDRVAALCEHQAKIERYVNFSGFEVESMIVFKNRVPITYANSEGMRSVSIQIYDNLDNI
jgi:hypothetical protein